MTAAAEIKSLFTLTSTIGATIALAANSQGYGTSDADRIVKTRYWLFVNFERAVAAFPERVAFVQHDGTAPSQSNRGCAPDRFPSAPFAALRADVWRQCGLVRHHRHPSAGAMCIKIALITCAL